MDTNLDQGESRLLASAPEAVAEVARKIFDQDASLYVRAEAVADLYVLVQNSPEYRQAVIDICLFVKESSDIRLPNEGAGMALVLLTEISEEAENACESIVYPYKHAAEDLLDAGLPRDQRLLAIESLKGCQSSESDILLHEATKAFDAEVRDAAEKALKARKG